MGSRHLESAQAFAQQYGIPRCYDSYEALAAGLLRAETIVYGERQLGNLLGVNRKVCEECYSDEYRITPLLNPLDCLENHTQYICGTCGRCICIEHDPNRGLQRWNFPFKSLEIAKLYLRTADYTTKSACGIYEIENSKGRVSYKIFAGNENLHLFLKKNKDKKCKQMTPVFNVGEYKEYPHAEIRKLTSDEIKQYMSES